MMTTRSHDNLSQVVDRLNPQRETAQYHTCLRIEPYYNDFVTSVELKEEFEP